MKNLHLPFPHISLGVKGRITLQLIHKSGLILHEHVQDNLILDSGLDYGMSGTDEFRFGSLHNYVAVGTGSVAPAANQTALGTEVARTQSALTFGVGEGITEITPGQFRYRRVRAFDYAQANGNLTEFGGSAFSAGTMHTRSLFKDGAGNPITVTKTSDTQLVITYDIEFTCSPTAATAASAINIAGLGSRDINIAFAKGIGFSSSGTSMMFGSNQSGYKRAGFYTSAMDMNYTGITPPNITDTTATFSAYVNGSFQRDVTILRSAAAADVTIYGYGLYSTWPNNNPVAAFKVQFANSFVKNKDYKLTCGLRISVARA